MEASRPRVLVTGSRVYNNPWVMRGALEHIAVEYGRLTSITVVHGGAPGADTLANRIAKEMGWDVEVHPADWERHGKAAGPIRNQEMVDSGADVCLAFPLGESIGTRDCMARAEKAGIPVVVFDDLT